MFVEVSKSRSLQTAEYFLSNLRACPTRATFGIFSITLFNLREECSKHDLQRISLIPNSLDDLCSLFPTTEASTIFGLFLDVEEPPGGTIVLYVIYQSGLSSVTDASTSGTPFWVPLPYW